MMAPVLGLARVHLGDVPTWLGAVFTGLAFAAALWVLSLQRRDLRERDDDRRKEQARHVSAWPIQYKPGSPLATLRGAYRNGSDEPIYNVYVYIKQRQGPVLVEGLVGTVLEPGHCHETDLPSFHPVSNGLNDLALLISIRDAAGIQWLRDEHGILKQVSTGSLPHPDPVNVLPGAPRLRRRPFRPWPPSPWG
jgi:hypothetical protein